MGAVQGDHWYLMILIFLPFLKVAVPQKSPVMVPLEEGMVLECLCPWQGTFSMVSWTKPPKKDPIAVFHPEFGMNFSHLYRERVEFLRSTPMDGSISLRNVTHQDIGLYLCSVQTFPQGSWKKSFQVEDLDEPPEEEGEGGRGNSSETKDLIQADTKLVAEQHSNTTLVCDGQRDNSAHEVTLERMAHDNQSWSIIGVCKKIEGGPVAPNSSDRGRLSCTHNLGLSLQLTSVQQQDAGLYRCTWSTDGGPQTTTVLFKVQPAVTGGFSLSAYVMYCYIGAGVAGFILIVIIIILAAKHNRHRKQGKRVEYRVKPHPSQRPEEIQADQRVSGLCQPVDCAPMPI